MLDKMSKKYIKVKNIIKSLRDNDVNWEEIKMFQCENDDELSNKLSALALAYIIDKTTVEEWKEIVLEEKELDEHGVIIYLPPVTIPSTNTNEFELDKSYGSSWSSYRRILKSKKFSNDTIDMIESSAHRILNKLSLDTTNSDPIKGLVIGNVQSGKTANMAALMAMAADQGWNLFIVLSGTIENLRIQTQDRLINDLKTARNVSWTPIDNVNDSNSFISSLDKLDFSKNSNKRYLMVCLKNSTRLKNVLKWIKKDLKTRSKLKILIIDDEADQAGVNAAPAKKKNDEVERTKINQSIVNILTNKDEDGKKVSTQFNALNYIAYTATPYANVLNEKPGQDSIYPSDFVSCLSVSNMYFGPQHIFGIAGTDYDGLSIINKIEPSEIDKIKNINIGLSNIMPKELESAILWFFCCFAIRKYRKQVSPVSMLIHTSQKQIHHEQVANLIKKWFSKLERLEFLKNCEIVFEKQTKLLTKEKFYKMYSNYGNNDILDYPSFKEIANTLLEIYNYGMSAIKIDDSGSINFSKGVHLCIDNCAHNFIENNNEHIRLLYPTKNDNVDFTTGFIVIGGATLSRGLTIEGLVSSYFLRTVKQADTLMQMGRWFGYRGGYELLPRIWMTDVTKNQFEFLSILDYELRQEMEYLENIGISPSQIGIKVKTHPKRSFLSLTSKNKLKDANIVEIDYGGLTPQTTIFYDDEEIINSNLVETTNFINGIDETMYKYRRVNNAHVWSGVPNENVLEFLGKLKFPKNDNSFLDLKLFSKWYEKIISENIIDNWNIVVAGKNGNNDVKFEKLGKYDISLVNRSKKTDKWNDGKIRIGALRSVKEMYLDIDDEMKGKMDEAYKTKLDSGNTKEYREIRNAAGLNRTSLLVIYVIDKDSQPKTKETDREEMNASNHVIGIYMIIPNDDKKQGKGSYMSIDISDTNISSEVDIDDEN